MEVLINRMSVVDIGVVRYHVLERSRASEALCPGYIVNILQLLDIFGPGGEILNFFELQGALGEDLICVFNLDLAAYQPRDSAVVDLMRASVAITLFALQSLDLLLVEVLCPFEG